MKVTTSTAIAALALIGVGGFMAGRISSSDPSTSGVASPVETKSSRSASASSSGPSDAASSSRSRRAETGDRSGAKTPEERLARLDTIIRGENPLDRSRAMLAFIDQLAPGDFEEAIAHFRGLGITESRMGEYSMLLAGWAEVDPMGALAYAKENTRSGFATSTILSTWASNDPEGAIRWAETNYTGNGANPYLAGIIRSLAATDPERATQLLTNMPKSNERGDALDAMLPHLITQGADAVRAWVENITDDSLRSGAMLRVADNLAATDPAGTAAWLLANPSEATQRRMDDVYSTWATKDETGAISSLAALPPGEDRSNALRGVVTSLAVKDPQTAVSLMDRFPSDVTDRVVQQVVWHSLGSDPAVAVNQIARMTNERERDQTYGRVLRVWTGRDPEAANAWIQNNPLPQSVRDRLNRQ